MHKHTLQYLRSRGLSTLKDSLHVCGPLSIDLVPTQNMVLGDKIDFAAQLVVTGVSSLLGIFCATSGHAMIVVL